MNKVISSTPTNQHSVQMVHYIENRLIKARKRFTLIACNNRNINEKINPIVLT